MLKNVLAVIAIASVALGSMAQEPGKKGDYQFTDVKLLQTTPVKNQNSSGTCWSFSGIAFLESELLRQGKPEMDLSEMFIVRQAYIEKAERYVRMHGATGFGAGGASLDVIDMVKKYGIVPEEVYRGLNYGTDIHRHGELDAVLEAYVKAVVTNKNRKLTPAWKEGYIAILDAYLGKFPETFTYEGKEYTPKSFFDSLGLNMDDYVSFTSFTHHPFDTQFAVEVPDNWACGLSYNVPLDDFSRILENSIDKGYTVFWASDVSERGFAYNKGYAIVPDDEVKDMSDSEKARWTTLTEEEKQAELKARKEEKKEKTITQENRQEAFDNYETTDDHGMQIVGTATDQNGTRFYKVKNSWGTDNEYGGYFYASEPFVLYKTISYVVNKNAVPKDIQKRLNLK
ncbi:MAG: aminopeptidase [Coprobacter sp.]|nr:aminopeptidase [Coprobacter sp.]